MNSSLKPLLSIYLVNSRLLLNSFEGVGEKLSLKRPNKKTNSMMFLLLHTMDARYYILRELGVDIKNPFAKYVDWANTIDDIKDYPPLKKILSEWENLESIFIDVLYRISAKKLKTKTKTDFPGGTDILNMIAFLAEHEAYHVGQLAFIRKYLGLKSVTF